MEGKSLKDRVAGLQSKDFLEGLASVSLLKRRRDGELATITEFNRQLGHVILACLNSTNFINGMTPHEITHVRLAVAEFVQDLHIEAPTLPLPLSHIGLVMTPANRKAEIDRREKEYLTKIMQGIQMPVLVRYLKHHLEIARLSAYLLDPTTGLYVRRAGLDFIEGLMDEDPDQWIAVVLHDIDRFKHINDTYGHPVGDVVLSKVGQVLRDTSRPGDMLLNMGSSAHGKAEDDFFSLIEVTEETEHAGSAPVRLGGEELVDVVRIPEDKDPRMVGLHVALRQNSSIRNTPISTAEYGDISVTVSTGVAVGPVHDFGEILLDADKAMYRAKKGFKEGSTTRFGDRNQVWAFWKDTPEPRDTLDLEHTMD